MTAHFATLCVGIAIGVIASRAIDAALYHWRVAQEDDDASTSVDFALWESEVDGGLL